MTFANRNCQAFADCGFMRGNSAHHCQAWRTDYHRRSLLMKFDGRLSVEQLGLTMSGVFESATLQATGTGENMLWAGIVRKKN